MFFVPFNLPGVYGPVNTPTVDPGQNRAFRPPTEDERKVLRAQRLKDGLCPECGKEGEWRPPASLVCLVDGPYMGC